MRDRTRKVLESAAGDVWSGLMVLDNFQESTPDLTPEELGPILNEIRSLKSLTAVVERSIENRLVEVMGRSKVTVDGLGVLQRYSGNKRKWDWEILLKELVVVSAPAEPTDDPTRDAAMWANNLLRNIRDVAGLDRESVTFRTEALNNLGLDPDDYSEQIPGRPSVRIIK